MKKITIITLSLLIGLISSARAQQEEYVFRNDVRPEYNKNISQQELGQLQSSGITARVVAIRISPTAA